VTRGVRLVGLASRSGITEVARQGFLVGFGVAFTGPALGLGGGLALGFGATSGTATRVAWLMPSRDSQKRVAGLRRLHDAYRPQAGPVLESAASRYWHAGAVDFGEGHDPRVRPVKLTLSPIRPRRREAARPEERVPGSWRPSPSCRDEWMRDPPSAAKRSPSTYVEVIRHVAPWPAAVGLGEKPPRPGRCVDPICCSTGPRCTGCRGPSSLCGGTC
jgi:hypothetical protein